MMNKLKKVVAMVLAGAMVIGAGLTSMAAGADAEYRTSFTGSSAMSAMANAVFDGADMVYDEDEGVTTVTVYTKLYERAYGGTTAYGWISELTLDSAACEIVKRETSNGYTYPAAFEVTFEGDLTDGAAFDASVVIAANGYEHAPQTGTLTLSK